MFKMNQKIKNRIGILKASGKKANKDYFLTKEGDLIIKKKSFNEIVRAI